MASPVRMEESNQVTEVQPARAITEVRFPAILYGDLKSTKRSWAQVARQALKAQTWHNSFTDDDFIGIVDHPGDILIQESRFGKSPHPDALRWRLYWAGKSLPLAGTGKLGKT